MARTTQASATRASFSWVALESAGISPNDFEMCGQALALLELRQCFFSSYRTFVIFSAASKRQQNADTRESNKLLRRSSRLRRQIRDNEHKSRLEMACLRLETAALFYRHLSSRHKVLSARSRTLTEGLGVSEGLVDYGSPSFATLGSFERWGRALRLWQSNFASPESDALAEATQVMLPEHVSELRAVGRLMADPSQTVAHLENHATYFASQIAGLYAARNLHLHGGLHEIPGEVGLALAGQSLTDSMLEIWAIWLTEDETYTPQKATSQLNSRFAQIIAALQAGQLVESLDPGAIAAPVWEPETS